MTTPENIGRFSYTHGLVWDRELDCGVPRAKFTNVDGKEVASIATWTPKPRILHVYRLNSGLYIWQWEPHPPGGPYAR